MTILSVNMDLASDGLANKNDLETRWQLEDLIEERGIGYVSGAGSGFGMMDISVEVEDAETATSQLRALAAELGIQEVNIHEYEE